MNSNSRLTQQDSQKSVHFADDYPAANPWKANSRFSNHNDSRSGSRDLRKPIIKDTGSRSPVRTSYQQPNDSYTQNYGQFDK